ncbi:MAG: hypothetical protein Udaeo2_32070 [Candidatus Udaeobacter sp.]|nr:MAG: hypothetical protein Udaeo2_32070 [Candidatus Udaeobacter sp.]
MSEYMTSLNLRRVREGEPRTPPSGARPGIETDRHRAIKHHLCMANCKMSKHFLRVSVSNSSSGRDRKQDQSLQCETQRTWFSSARATGVRRQG